MKKYQQNLSVSGSEVYSYNTLVAKINYQDRTCTALNYFSKTTQKHINYVCSELGLTQIKGY